MCYVIVATSGASSCGSCHCRETTKCFGHLSATRTRNNAAAPRRRRCVSCVAVLTAAAAAVAVETTTLMRMRTSRAPARGRRCSR